MVFSYVSGGNLQSMNVINAYAFAVIPAKAGTWIRNKAGMMKKSMLNNQHTLLYANSSWRMSGFLPSQFVCLKPSNNQSKFTKTFRHANYFNAYEEF
jgi:hypothetical protein